MPEPPVNEWDAVYAGARPEDLPWFTTKLDPDVEAALKRLKVAPRGGPVLDVGTGPGTAAIELARRGFPVVALDVSPKAIEMARKRAGDLGPKIEWVARDLFTASWDSRFQLILDRGVYHTLTQGDRNRYPDLVATWLKPGGVLIIKTFSPAEPGDWGPNRITHDELETNLGGRLDLLTLEASTFPGSLDHAPQAWIGVFQRPA